MPQLESACPCIGHTLVPNQQELVILVDSISHRVVWYFECQGILERDEVNSHLQFFGAV